MSKKPIAWYRPPSEDAPDGEAVYGPRDPNMPGMDTGWLPAYAPGADAPEFAGVARRKLDELLEALITLVDCVDGNYKDVTDLARAAIAKATGEMK